MTQLHTKIKLYLGRNYKDSEIELQNDGEGTYISFWSDSLEKTKPTDEQLNALESEATKLENNNQIRATRRNLYGDIGDQLDEIFKNIDDWKARIQKIKTDNPKESS